MTRVAMMIGLALAACFAAPIAAQTASEVRAPGGFAPMQAPCVRQAGGACLPVSATVPLPVSTRSETYRLVTANAPNPAATLFGGSYVLAQGCATYGTVTLRYLGPDGVTMTALVSKTAADSTGGTPLSFGSNAIVDVVLSGTTGCNVSLSRIP